VRHNLAFGEAAHLLADCSERLIEIAAADRDTAALRHQGNETRPALISSNRKCRQQTLDLLRNRGRREAKVTRPYDLALTHGNAAGNLSEILLDPDRNRKLIDLAQVARGSQPLGIVRERTDRRHIGGKPGKPMQGALG
jgi:hypothetical protein